MTAPSGARLGIILEIFLFQPGRMSAHHVTAASKIILSGGLDLQMGRVK